jgi:hypothetical protein
MNKIENEIKNILFEIGKDIKIHKLIDGNLIVEIDYDKYTKQLINLFNKNYPKSDFTTNSETSPETRS